jgi:hypothetical protein
MSTVLLTNPDNSSLEQQQQQLYHSLADLQQYRSLDRRQHRKMDGGGGDGGCVSFEGSFTAVSSARAGSTFHVAASNPFRRDILSLPHITKEQLRFVNKMKFILL